VSNLFDNVFDFMLNSGWLFFAAGAVICIVIGFSAVRKMFAGASRAEPKDPPEHHHHKH
jgi:hypothetical protein